MSKKPVVQFLILALLIGFAGAASSTEKPTVVEKVNLLASRPILEVLQARHISAEERTTAYVYADRIEYYDNALTSEILRLTKLPATAENGVLFTEVFLTQFRKHPGLYVVQRGWDQAGNCQVLTSKLRTNTSNATRGGIANKDTELEIEPGNSCSGDPCQKCKPYDRDLGCICEIGTRCNHTVTSN